MNIKIDKNTYSAIEEALQNRENTVLVRIFMAGVGCCGPTFGLSIDKFEDNDVVDETRDIKFIIANDLYENYGDFQIELIGEGYKVSPVKPIEGANGCGSCGGGCH
jgi:HesB-like selenoprotein